MTTTQALPHWDTKEFFPGLGSPEFAAARDGLRVAVLALGELFDRLGVRAGGAGGVPAATVAEVLASANDVMDRARLVGGYVALFTATDAADSLASALEDEVRATVSPVGPLLKRLDAWLAELPGDVVPDGYEWVVERARVAAAHQLTEAEEALVAELDLSGGAAWARLHREISGRLTVSWPDAEEGALPMAAVRALSSDPDASVRRAALAAELAAWKQSAVALAAALNGVKGQAATLNRRRGWPDALAPVLAENGIERPAFDAMQDAVDAGLPVLHRYLGAKARLLGHRDGRMPWADLNAPLPGEAAAAPVDWEGTREAVLDAFATYGGPMLRLAESAFAEQWVDAAVRTGKRDGAFCTSLLPGRSRVLLNHSGHADAITTLAHEFGHAFHNWCLRERTALQKRTPMALAETASTFCELVTLSAQLDAARDAPEARLALLDHDLQRCVAIVVDIRSRFRFEHELFERRADRALSVAELCDAMARAQRDAYGDALADEGRHRYMWAAKPHYCSRAFYNWPYTFGLLLGTALFARFREAPDDFRPAYERFLASTGCASAAALAADFGFDLADPGFWLGGVAAIEQRVDQFEVLAGTAGG